MPRVKRCPKHSRRKPRKTGRCVHYNPPYQKKYERCKNGTRDDGSGRPFPENCVNYTQSNRSKRWTRCKKGTRKNKTTGKCEPYRKSRDVSYNSRTASELNDDDKDVLIQKLNKEREKLKAMIKKPNKSMSEPIPEVSLKKSKKSIKRIPSKERIVTLSSTKSKSKSKTKSSTSMKLLEDKKSSLNSKEKKIVKKVTKKWKSYKRPKKSSSIKKSKKSISEPKPESKKPSKSSSDELELINSNEEEKFRKFRAHKIDKAIKKFPGKSPEYIEKQLKYLYKHNKYGDF